MLRSTRERPVEGRARGRAILLVRGVGGGGSESEMPVGLRQLNCEVRVGEATADGRAAKRPCEGQERGRPGYVAFQMRPLYGNVSGDGIEDESLPNEVRGIVCHALSEGPTTLAAGSEVISREVCEAVAVRVAKIDTARRVTSLRGRGVRGRSPREATSS